jgi:hypothetical protein
MDFIKENNQMDNKKVESNNQKKEKTQNKETFEKKKENIQKVKKREERTCHIFRNIPQIPPLHCYTGFKKIYFTI